MCCGPLVKVVAISIFISGHTLHEANTWKSDAKATHRAALLQQLSWGDQRAIPSFQHQACSSCLSAVRICASRVARHLSLRRDSFHGCVTQIWHQWCADVKAVVWVCMYVIWLCIFVISSSVRLPKKVRFSNSVKT